MNGVFPGLRARDRTPMVGAGLVLAIGLGAGCASTGGPVRTTTAPAETEVLTPVDGRTVEVTRSKVLSHFDFAAPVDKVWLAMMEVQAAVGIPVTSFDTNQRTALFVAQNRYRQILEKPASLFLDCGTGPTGPKADSYRLLIRVSHALAPSGNNATVLTSGVAAYASRPGVSGDQVPCINNGRLERDLAALIEARLQQSN